MDAIELRKLIEQLQIEIQKAKTVNEKDQEMLVQLDSEIHELLGRIEGKEVHIHPTTIKRLEDNLSHFEASHPTLTMVISQVLDALSSIGI
jgi:predicted  nucleic acid-binding Zn-ribbon protein